MSTSKNRAECPQCKRAVVNKKVAVCLYCGAELPRELLFSEKESAQAEKDYKKEEARFASMKEREREYRKRRDKERCSPLDFIYENGDSFDLFDFGGD